MTSNTNNHSDAADELRNNLISVSNDYAKGWETNNETKMDSTIDTMLILITTSNTNLLQSIKAKVPEKDTFKYSDSASAHMAAQIASNDMIDQFNAILDEAIRSSR